MNKKILLGICGGIAAYKSAYLVRSLTTFGAEVRVVMTQSACAFITPMTMQALSGQDVRCELFDTQAERAMGHIELARWADILLIAPASANCLAKLAHGQADDLLSTIYLVTQAPVIVCPAMNHSMWHHPATRQNIDVLKQRGVVVVGPSEGAQACGDIGPGRLSDVDDIITALRQYDVYQLLSGKSVLITAGPTEEPIDPVRYISNRSSGKMGYALAQAALIAGAHVTLISGPVALTQPQGVSFFPVKSAQSMLEAVHKQLKPGMIVIAAAAVADYHVKEPSLKKIKKKNNETVSLHLVKNPDILASVATSGEASFVVGFAAETHDVLLHAQTKLINKHLDMVIANEVGDNLGFGKDEHEVTIVTKEQTYELPLAHKERLAASIIKAIHVLVSRQD